MIRRIRFGVFSLAPAALASMALGTAVLAQDKPATPPPAAAPPAAAAPQEAAPPAAPMVNEVKILFDDKAKNDGELVFSFTPEGGAAKLIKVTIQKKDDRKDAARDAAKELDVALGSDYKVDRYDPDKIKVEGKSKKKFSLTIASLTANGLSVRVK